MEADPGCACSACLKLGRHPGQEEAIAADPDCSCVLCETIRWHESTQASARDWMRQTFGSVPVDSVRVSEAYRIGFKMGLAVGLASVLLLAILIAVLER